MAVLYLTQTNKKKGKLSNGGHFLMLPIILVRPSSCKQLCWLNPFLLPPTPTPQKAHLTLHCLGPGSSAAGKGPGSNVDINGWACRGCGQGWVSYPPDPASSTQSIYAILSASKAVRAHPSLLVHGGEKPGASSPQSWMQEITSAFSLSIEIKAYTGALHATT